MITSDLIKAIHLSLLAIIYIRQSSPHQALTNQESLRLQYALKQLALELGWREDQILIIDADQGQTASTTGGRQGFKELVAMVSLGQVGIILSIEVTRLSRNCSDWYPLLDICGYRNCLIGDRDGIYDPSTINGRLLLGLKGQISELELHTIRGRLTAGILSKAQRGELALTLPVGLIRDPLKRVFKHPDIEVQGRISLIFETFLQVRSAAQVVRSFNDNNLLIPRKDDLGDVVWRRPTVPAICSTLKNPAYAGAFVYGRTRTMLKAGSTLRAYPEEAPHGRMEDPDQRQVPCLRRLGDLRDDSGHAPRQLQRIRPKQDPGGAPAGQGAAAWHGPLRRMRAPDGRAVQTKDSLYLQSSTTTVPGLGLPVPPGRSDR